MLVKLQVLCPGVIQRLLRKPIECQKKVNSQRAKTIINAWIEWKIKNKGIKAAVGQGTDAAAIATDRLNKQVIFKNCTLLIDCISEINDTKIDDTKDLDVVMTM